MRAQPEKDGGEAPGALAQLWGKDSKVKCTFDTEGGGTLTFEVDGEQLDLTVSNVFSLLGTDDVFPCVCLFPLESTDDSEDSAKQLADEESEEETSTTEEESERDSDYVTDSDSNGDEESEEEEIECRKKQEDIEELAKATNLNVSIIMAMSQEKREELRENVKTALEASRRARVTILYPRAPEVPDDACTTAPKDKEQDQGQNDDNGDEEDEGGEEDEEDEEQEAAKNKKLAADEGTQPLEKIRWIWEQSSGLWEVYSPEISRELELARRAGESEVTIRYAENAVLCKISGGHSETVQERGEETQRLRRHLIKDGILGMLEMQSVMHQPPHSLVGESCLTTLQKVWSNEESLSGRACGLGFLFIYSLLQGQQRAKVLSSGFSDWFLGDSAFGFGGIGGGGLMSASASDSHRLGLLLTQLLTDAKTKGVLASVLNVMGRNKQLSVRFPEFRDTRKNRSNYIFNGWTDDREPKSAILDLFDKLVPLMQGMKKSKHGSFIFPPKSLGTEMPAPPSTFKVARNAGVDLSTFRADLSDLDCKEQRIHPISQEHIREMAVATKRTDWRANAGVRHSERLPINVDDELHLEDVVKTNKYTLFVFIFHASWCGMCTAIHPLLCKLALRSPTARFVRIDIETMHRLCYRLDIKSVPTIKLVRPNGETPVTKAHVLGTIKEIEEEFAQTLLDQIASVSTPEEITRMTESSETGTEEQLTALCKALAVTSEDLTNLSSFPLKELSSYIEYQTVTINAKTPTLDVGRHAAAQSAVAQSMLKRMKDDVVTHLKNDKPSPKLKCVSSEVLRVLFSGTDDAATRRKATQECIREVDALLAKLQELRAKDIEAVHSTSLLSDAVVNCIDLSAGGFDGRLERSKFVLRRAASQATEVWLEFLFASILSSQGTQDLQRLNPYVSLSHIGEVTQLIMVSMLKANRVGHLSRCVEATVVLLTLLRDALDTPPGPSSLGTFLQASDDVANIISAGRHFVGSRQNDVHFDPRFLIFEFTWNILLRKKQVEIVLDFVAQVKSGNSKVKQMIMGEGKTTGGWGSGGVVCIHIMVCL